jgi:recombination protein RecT
MSGNTAMSKSQVQLKSLADLLESKRGSLNALVANGLKPDRLIKVVVAAASKTPKLLECTQVSIYRSLTEAASLGVEPNGPLGHGYLVPYSNKGQMECQFILSYKGMIDLARRSGQILSIESRVVYAGDEFDFEFGLAPKCRHVPKAQDQSDEKITHSYAVAHLVGGGTQFEVLTKAQVDGIRAKSRAGKFGPWQDHYAEMAKKSAVRRLFKYLPISIEIAEATQKEDRMEAGEQTIDMTFVPSDADGPDGEVIVEATMTDKLKAQIGGES